MPNAAGIHCRSGTATLRRTRELDMRCLPQLSELPEPTGAPGQIYGVEVFAPERP